VVSHHKISKGGGSRGHNMAVRKNMLIDCEVLTCVHSIPESAGRQYTVGTLAVADLGHRMKSSLQPFLVPLPTFLGPPYSAPSLHQLLPLHTLAPPLPTPALPSSLPQLLPPSTPSSTSQSLCWKSMKGTCTSVENTVHVTSM